MYHFHLLISASSAESVPESSHPGRMWAHPQSTQTGCRPAQSRYPLSGAYHRKTDGDIQKHVWGQYRLSPEAFSLLLPLLPLLRSDAAGYSPQSVHRQSGPDSTRSWDPEKSWQSHFHALSAIALVSDAAYPDR